MLLGPELYFPFGVFDSLTNDFQGEAKRSLDRADTYNLFLVARLRDGVSREGAAEAMKALGASLEQAFPVEHKNQAFAIAELPRLGSSTSPSQFGHAIGSPGRSTRAGTLNGAPRPALVAPRALQTHQLRAALVDLAAVAIHQLDELEQRVGARSARASISP